MIGFSTSDYLRREGSSWIQKSSLGGWRSIFTTANPWLPPATGLPHHSIPYYKKLNPLISPLLLSEIVAQPSENILFSRPSFATPCLCVIGPISSTRSSHTRPFPNRINKSILANPTSQPLVLEPLDHEIIFVLKNGE